MESDELNSSREGLASQFLQLGAVSVSFHPVVENNNNSENFVTLLKLKDSNVKDADTVMLVTFSFIEIAELLLALQSPLSFDNQVLSFKRVFPVDKNPILNVTDLPVEVYVKEREKPRHSGWDLDSPLNDFDFAQFKGPSEAARNHMDSAGFVLCPVNTGNDGVATKIEAMKMGLKEDLEEESVAGSSSSKGRDVGSALGANVNQNQIETNVTDQRSHSATPKENVRTNDDDARVVPLPPPLPRAKSSLADIPPTSHRSAAPTQDTPSVGSSKDQQSRPSGTVEQKAAIYAAPSNAPAQPRSAADPLPRGADKASIVSQSFSNAVDSRASTNPAGSSSSCPSRQDALLSEAPTRYVNQTIQRILSFEDKNNFYSTPPLKCQNDVVSFVLPILVKIRSNFP